MYKELLQLNNKNADNPIKKQAKDLNSYFIKRSYTNGNKHSKKWSTPLVLREIQTTMKYHYKLTEVSRILKIDKPNVGKSVEQLELLLVGM